MMSQYNDSEGGTASFEIERSSTPVEQDIEYSMDDMGDENIDTMNGNVGSMSGLNNQNGYTSEMEPIHTKDNFSKVGLIKGSLNGLLNIFSFLIIFSVGGSIVYLTGMIVADTSQQLIKVGISIFKWIWSFNPWYFRTYAIFPLIWFLQWKYVHDDNRSRFDWPRFNKILYILGIMDIGLNGLESSIRKFGIGVNTCDEDVDDETCALDAIRTTSLMVMIFSSIPVLILSEVLNKHHKNIRIVPLLSWSGLSGIVVTMCMAMNPSAWPQNNKLSSLMPSSYAQLVCFIWLFISWWLCIAWVSQGFKVPFCPGRYSSR